MFRGQFKKYLDLLAQNMKLTCERDLGFVRSLISPFQNSNVSVYREWFLWILESNLAFIFEQILVHIWMSLGKRGVIMII
jgi:hypothetical protein